MKLSEDPRFAKLPAWVQREVKTLEMQKREAEEHAAKAALRGGPSNTYIKPYDDNPIFLDNDEAVAFQVATKNPERYWNDVLHVRLEKDLDGKGYIEVRGSTVLSIRPTASNVIRVGLE